MQIYWLHIILIQETEMCYTMIDAPFNSLYVVQIFKVFHNLKIAPSVSVYFCHGCGFSHTQV